MTGPAAIGLVLAGGLARRMQAGAGDPSGGVRKESLEVGGVSLLERVVAAVGRETRRVVVVTAPDRPLPPLSLPVEVVHDSEPGSGPLAAIRDGLGRLAASEADAALVFVASCDLPLLEPGLVRLLLDRAAASGADWTAASVGGHVQVLCSAVRLRLLDAIAAWLAGGRRDPRGLFAALTAERAARTCILTAAECATVDPRLVSFQDVDTPADHALVARQLTYGERAGEAYTPPP